MMPGVLQVLEGGGAEVVRSLEDVILSWQPQMMPGVLQVLEGESEAEEVDVVLVRSGQLVNPGDWQEVGVGALVVVSEGPGVAVAVVVVVGSLHPNHPGVLQVEVLVVDDSVVVEVVVVVVVVVSSRHPHQPGVLHVDVFVDVGVEVGVEVVDISESLPLKNFHSWQS
jgi:hypothetical protein